MCRKEINDMMTFTHKEVETLLQMVVEDIHATGHFPYVPSPKLDTTLRGKCSGQAYCGANLIRINLTSRSEEDMINTLKHEIAHLMQYMFFQRRGHGPHWKRIMEQIGGRPVRCHNMPLPSARNMRKVTYTCGCRDMEISMRKSNSIEILKSVWKCRACGQVIVKKYKVESRCTVSFEGDVIGFNIEDAQYSYSC